MKTWREQIADARRRGRFLYDGVDGERWSDLDNCPAGEIVKRMTGLSYKETFNTVWCKVWHGTNFRELLLTNDFDGADARLDELEELASKIKLKWDKRKIGTYPYMENTEL
jgi:hypothetical protein